MALRKSPNLQVSAKFAKESIALAHARGVSGDDDMPLGLLIVFQGTARSHVLNLHLICSTARRLFIIPGVRPKSRTFQKKNYRGLKRNKAVRLCAIRLPADGEWNTAAQVVDVLFRSVQRRGSYPTVLCICLVVFLQMHLAVCFEVGFVNTWPGKGRRHSNTPTVSRIECPLSWGIPTMSDLPWRNFLLR